MNILYLQDENGTINFSRPVTKLTRLDAGIYMPGIDSQGEILLTPFKAHTDGLITLPDSPAELIDRNVNDFLTKDTEEKFNRYNIVYKRGILMYGPPGTGKTSIVHILMKTAVEKDMIILLNPQSYLVPLVVDTVRSIEDTDRSFMVVWEEFENVVYHQEGVLLNLLDGVQSVPGVFYIATTNYIQQIPERIRNRPSRFAEVMEIGFPSRELRRAFLAAKIHKDDDIDVDLWADRTEGMSIDHLKDLIISVLVIGVPLDEAIIKLNNLESLGQPEEVNESANSLKVAMERMRVPSVSSCD